MYSILKQHRYWPRANKLLKETLFVWIDSNEPSGKGGVISSSDIREMDIELAQDTRFGDISTSNLPLVGLKAKYISCSQIGISLMPISSQQQTMISLHSLNLL